MVVKLADIGDVLTATPALRALRASYPAARIDLLTTPLAATVAPASLVDEVLTAPRALVRTARDAPALARLLLRLRGGRYDSVLFLHHLTLRSGAAKYRLLAAAAGAANLAGLDNGRGGWLTHPVADRGFGAQHEVVYGLQVAAALGAHTADQRLAAAFDERDAAAAGRWLAGLQGGLRVAIHPGSGGYSLARRWDPGKWAALADALAGRWNAAIILVGAAADGVEAVQAAMRTPALNLAGQTSLGQLAAVLAQSDLFLGADSGVMHLAAAVGAPVVALFGPSNPQAWGPWTPAGRSAVVRLGLACAPCSYVGHAVGQRDGCWHRSCLADLQPGQVLAAAESLLGRPEEFRRPGQAEEASTGRGAPEQAQESPAESGILGSSIDARCAPALPGAVEILGVRVHAVTYGQTLDLIAHWIAQGGPHQIATANPEFVMAAQRDAAFRQVLNTADLCAPDGVGLLWAARVLGQRLPERVTGSDLTPLLAQEAARRGWRLFLLGAGPGVAERAAQRLAQRSPGLRVVGCYEGSPDEREADAIIGRIQAAQPDLLLVAYGAPAQDLWIARHKARLGAPAMMGVGGAFDHIAGVRRRAPRWLQRVHLEWLFRLITQPWRWRRQLALPRFVAAVLRQRLARTAPMERRG